ncbi:MAG: hypothetical protein ACI3XI_01185 [Eubacteriales bacterium]
MARVRQVSQKTRRRHKFERALVWLKYLSPAILTFCSWIFCNIKCVRFINGAEIRKLQSVNEMVTQAMKSLESFDPLKEDSYTELLANALRPLTVLYVLAFAIAAVISLYMLVYAFVVLPGDPMAVSTNRAKLWFKTFFPSKLLLVLPLVLPVYPAFMPYIIRYCFYKYYVMNDLTVICARFNPAVAVSVLAALFFIFFLAVAPLEERHRMDPFKRYDEED